MPFNGDIPAGAVGGHIERVDGRDRDAWFRFSSATTRSTTAPASVAGRTLRATSPAGRTSPTTDIVAADAGVGGRI